MPHLVFLTVFLGLISGLQPVHLRVDATVKSVKLTLDGREVARLTQAPWRTTVDFGQTIEPAELVAIGYDERGEEVGRVSQILNLARPIAEAQILVHDADGLPAYVDLVGHHLQFAKPTTGSVRVDGVKVKVSGLRARLPQLDWTRSHVISAELNFQDGSVARSELVLNGGYSEAVGSQLSPAFVKTESASTDIKDCVFADDTKLRVSAVERNSALIIFVLDPNRAGARRIFDRWRPFMNPALRNETTLPANMVARVVWPIAEYFTEKGGGTSILFQHTDDISVSKAGLMWLLSLYPDDHPTDNHPRQFADAIAVGAVQTFMPPRPGAVVYVLSDTPDKSHHRPAQVRPYLDAIHVPLFVWSLEGARPDLAFSWGEVVDISTPERFRTAIDTLKRTVEAERVAWVAADPLTALRAEVRCPK